MKWSRRSVAHKGAGLSCLGVVVQFEVVVAVVEGDGVGWEWGFGIRIVVTRIVVEWNGVAILFEGIGPGEIQATL